MLVAYGWWGLLAIELACAVWVGYEWIRLQKEISENEKETKDNTKSDEDSP